MTKRPEDPPHRVAHDEDGDVAPPGPGHVIPSGPSHAGPIDLETDYLGLTLKSPIVASASPMTGDLPSLQALAEAGVGAVVLPSLFEEQIVHESTQLDRMHRDAQGLHPEAPGGYTPPLDDYNDGAVRYLDLVRDAKGVVGVPVIASLNGASPGGWARYAAMLADAGADAIELNVYRVAADPNVDGREVESQTLSLVTSVREAVDIPLAVKLAPYWSALGSFANRLVDAGADGLVLFNRFYQPDIDLETLRVTPSLVLSSSAELRLPLRWCAILHDRVSASLAATTGVHTGEDVAKVLLAGADVAMTTSALLKHGPGHVRILEERLRTLMAERGYGSATEMRGAISQAKAVDPDAFERANYLQALTRYASSYSL
jgi:dihydroorotate dehydrogenase (fumarate)